MKIWLVGLALVTLLTLLAACGESSPTAVPAQPTTAPAATPMINPTATAIPSPTAGQPVVVIPPATVTPIGNTPNRSPVATIPPAPTGPVPTAPASTPIGTIHASGDSTTQSNPVVTAAPPPTTEANNTTPAETTGAASQTTAATSNTQSGPTAIFYYKDGDLLENLAGKNLSVKVAANVFGYVQTGPNRVVVIQQNVTTANPSLDLKLVTLDNGKLQATTLDTRLFEELPVNQQNERPGGKYGIDTRAMGEMAVSPDGTQLVYTKGNLSGVTFEGMSDAGDRPTELWLVNLDPKNPAPKQIVANDKNYIARPLWSPDGNRITFIRTSLFGTGAGYPTELWSVYKDGSRLAYLTGPDLGKIGDNPVSAAPALNIRWVGPQVLAFEANNQAHTPIFLHDLSQGRDLPMLLTAEPSYDTVYCDGIQRFIYTTANEDGSPKPGAYSIGITNPANQTGTVDKDALRLIDCKGTNLLYLNSKNELVIARLTPEGKVISSKSLPVGKDFQQINIKLSPNGKMAAVQVNKTVQVLSESGQVTEIKAGEAQIDILSLRWASDKVLVALNNRGDQPWQLLEVNLDGEKVFQNLDEGERIDFALPTEVAKEDF